MPQMGLDGKVAIVTGAGSRADGIGNGRAASILLARAGAKVDPGRHQRRMGRGDRRR